MFLRATFAGWSGAGGRKCRDDPRTGPRKSVGRDRCPADQRRPFTSRPVGTASVAGARRCRHRAGYAGDFAAQDAPRHLCLRLEGRGTHRDRYGPVPTSDQQAGVARLRRLDGGQTRGGVYAAACRAAEPAESPMETRLRWLLIAARLPRPEVQTDLYDAQGRFVGRADLYYREARLVIEFDGGNHREGLVSNDRRQNLLMTAGFRVLRFTAADVHHRPDVIEAQVRSAVGRVRRVA